VILACPKKLKHKTMSTWVKIAVDTNKMSVGDRAVLEKLFGKFNYVKSSLSKAESQVIIEDFKKLGVTKHELDNTISPIPATKNEIETDLRIHLLQLQIDQIKNKKWIERHPLWAIVISLICAPLLLELIKWLTKLLLKSLL
jgi:hypothetical protein